MNRPSDPARMAARKLARKAPLVPSTPTRRLAAVAAGALVPVVALALSACAQTSSGGGTANAGSTGSASATATACTMANLKTKTPGTLTIATDEPVYEPWFVDDKPENGKGFECAVAYAVAEKLGYAGRQGDLDPGPLRRRDLAGAEEVRLRHQRVLDHRRPQEGRRLLLRLLRRDPGRGHRQGLQDRRRDHDRRAEGRQARRPERHHVYDAIDSVIKPTQPPAVFNTNDVAVQALKNDQIDGLVVDLPTAFYMTGAQINDGVVVGQFDSPGTPEQFGLLLEKGSPLTAACPQAVDALRADGTLDALETQWLTGLGRRACPATEHSLTSGYASS